MGRAFSSSYLAREAAACAFFPHDFRDGQARIARARAVARRTISPALAAVLREQQALLPASPARQKNLQALIDGRCAVVVSGQQVGLFLGPLYTFYKAASAIAVARAIEGESGVRCVPLFWLQTEDHDFAEIAGCQVASTDGAPVTLTLASEPAEEARRSVAHRMLGPEVTALVEALGTHLGDGPGAQEVMAALRAHYAPGRPLAQAFAGALATVFADEGLLFLDPRDPRVAALAAPVYRRSLEAAAVIDERLGARASAMNDAGFIEQVPLRPGSSLLFFHADDPRGPRHRLRRGEAPGQWRTTMGETVPEAALLRLLADTPLRFSTSALLRPIVQDTLLPTVAYVGGPAEVSYFAQLMPLYPLFDLTPPLIVPRARFTCIDARARRLLEALKLEPRDLGRPTAELLARLPVSRPADAPDPAALKRIVAEQLTAQVAGIADAIVAARPHLARAAARTRHSVAHALTRLTDRYARELLDADVVTRRQLQRLQDLLYPGGAPQERVYGWPTLAAQLGPATLKRLVFEQLAQAGPYVTEALELRP
ncbi:MAG TPA: bacillithiol biosynthesis cysteine-adding enzyme BshC [Polyangia bacterium]